MCHTREDMDTYFEFQQLNWICSAFQVDHCAAIKEYSRSSADQEEPLSHELRPLPVLSMTMDYLVTQIMDQGEGNYRDWYDFVWNRTRGIRKVWFTASLCILIVLAIKADVALFLVCVTVDIFMSCVSAGYYTAAPLWPSDCVSNRKVHSLSHPLRPPSVPGAYDVFWCKDQ